MANNEYNYDKYILDYVRKIKKTTEFLKSKVDLKPEIGIVLGSGLEI